MDRNIIKYNSLKARFELGFLNPKATAQNVNYIGVIIKFLFGATLLLYISSSFFIALNHIVYFAQNILKLFLFGKSQLSGYRGYHNSSLGLTKGSIKCKDVDLLVEPESDGKYVNDDKIYDDEYPLPLYSILVPMYQEGIGVKTIIYHLSKLDYPTKLLEIKLVLEEDDLATINVLNSMALPSHIEVIRVPYSEPRTKPKAMNFAMEYIKGEYVVIYDVEDRPEQDQLRKALVAFNQLPEEVICMQGKLCFYNHGTNLLTKLFNIEYQIWFDFLLPAIDKFDLPVPLGGNSNHFKVDPLRKLGLWDAYNVTEDADLGLRLSMYGYKTKILDSYSFEEAPIDVYNWLNQRSRWIKGFLQTFLVYLRQDKNLKAKMRVKSRIYIYIFLGFSTYSFLFLPWYFILSDNRDFINIVLSKWNIYTAFLYMYYSAATIIASHKHKTLLDLAALLIWPFYFILHVVAAYKALFELITKPFCWNKTKHQISEE
jgi:cellulose synthase/poly-beta-1,6-N-acetylglucosamine synthase-like glycosyltransferase